MPKTKRVAKVRLAILCGLAVAVISIAVHVATLPMDRTLLLHAGIGDFIAGLTAVIVSLAIQLRQEEVHYRTAMERAAIVRDMDADAAHQAGRDPGLMAGMPCRHMGHSCG